MFNLVHLLFSLLAISVGCFLRHTAVPAKFPRNVPLISIYLRVYDVLRGVTEVDFYNNRVRKHLAEHGAVGLWLEGQWAILIGKPEYICQVLRDKSRSLSRYGFYLRVPGSTAAGLFGENIIDSDGELHDEFSKHIKPGIERRHDFGSLMAKSSQLVSALLRLQTTAASSAGVSVSQAVFQWSVSVYGEYFLDIEFDPLNFDEYNIQAILAAQNRSAIGRLKALFPALDRLPWSWTVTRQTRKRFADFEAMLMEQATRTLNRKIPQGNDDKVIHRMNRARMDGNMSEFHYRSNMKQLFIAGAENVESALISAMLELAKNAVLQEQLYHEIEHALPAGCSDQDLRQLPLLSAVIYETLRMYPPLALMRNRRTAEMYWLGDDILIPEGVIIARNAYGVQTDTTLWADAATFQPMRWGSDIVTVNSTFSREQVSGRYIPFGLHSRRCLGSSFAIHQLRIALYKLVLTAEWSLSPGYQFSFSKGAVLAPSNCKFVFKQRH